MFSGNWFCLNMFFPHFNFFLFFLNDCFQEHIASRGRWRRSLKGWKKMKAVAAVSQVISPTCSPSTRPLASAGWLGRWPPSNMCWKATALATTTQLPCFKYLTCAKFSSHIMSRSVPLRQATQIKPPLSEMQSSHLRFSSSEHHLLCDPLTQTGGVVGQRDSAGSVAALPQPFLRG